MSEEGKEGFSHRGPTRLPPQKTTRASAVPEQAPMLRSVFSFLLCTLRSTNMKLIFFPPFALLGASCAHSLNHEPSMNEAAIVAAPVIEICGQTWMTRNLDVAKYRNGDTIPGVEDSAAWVNLTTGAWCWYNNDSATHADAYGRLYNWYAVNDPRGLVPEGWHVPTDQDWSAMETCLGNDSVGYRLREAGTTHWICPSTAADNSSGFKGLPGGIRSTGGEFSGIGFSGVFWTSSEGSSSDAWCGRLIHHVNRAGVGAMVTGIGYMNKLDGYSVRCVKHAPAGSAQTSVFAPEPDTAQAYRTAIAEYIKATRERSGAFPDTLYIGRHAEFPAIALPPVIAHVNIRIVTPGSAEALKNDPHFVYLNVFCWFTEKEAEFLVVTFGSRFRHVRDINMHFNYSSQHEEFLLDGSRVVFP